MRRPATRGVLAVGAVGAALTVAVGLSSCGIPTGDDTFSEIPAEEDLFGLGQSTTSTSTTTSTTIANLPATTALETTTTNPPLVQEQIYFLSRQRLQPVPYLFTPGFGPDQVITALESGPPAEGGAGLDTLIEVGLIESAVVATGVVTIDLDPEIFRRIASFDQSEAIGQIVLTFVDSVDRVGGVLFTLGGEPTEVKDGTGAIVGSAQPVTFDDYIELLGSSPATTTTTTTPVPAETAAPAPPDTTIPA